MAGSQYVQCVGPSYHLADRKAAIQSAINCFPMKVDDGRFILSNTPGTINKTAFPGVARGSFVAFSRWFVVFGKTLYELDTAGNVLDNIGDLNTSTGPVGMKNNETQLAIVDGPYLYIMPLATNALQVVTSDGWLGSKTVDYMDGYFIFAKPDSNIWYISAIDDGTQLDALDFTSADASPDKIDAVRVNHHQLLIFCGKHIEIWVDSGASDFPFVRYNSYPVDIGCVGSFAQIDAADTVFFVGRTNRGTGIFYQLTGNQPVPVSTNPVQESLLKCTDMANIVLWRYQSDDGEFVGIAAPGLPTTWVFDAKAQLWHERAEWVDNDWSPMTWGFVTSVGVLQFAGDSAGNLMLLDGDTDTLSGRVLKRVRTWPHTVAPSMEPISYLSLEIAPKSGSGGVIWLEISNDGGYNFGTPLPRSLGAIGRWVERVRWNGLGTASNRVFRLSQSDPVPFGIYQAAVDVAP